MVHTERYLSAAFGRSAFETARRLRARRGKTLALHNAPHELIELRPTAEAMEFARFLR